MTSVRELTRADVEDLIILSRMFHAENAPHLDFDAQKIRDRAEQLFADLDRDNLNVFMAYKDGEPVGFILGWVNTYLFSYQVIAHQELWYVIPAFRGTRIAFRLIKEFEEWARLRGAVEIFTGVASHDAEKNKNVSHVLTRMGYPRVGYYHKKRTV